MIVVTVKPEVARSLLAFYLDVVAGKGCGCMQLGLRSTPCETLFRHADRIRNVVVEEDPELTAELRAAIAKVLALQPSGAFDE